MTDLDPRNSISWEVQESSFRGQWTREGEGGIDEQSYIHFTGDRLTIFYAEDRVFCRREGPNGLHFYNGIISDNKRSIRGEYLAELVGGVLRWNATLRY